MKTIAFVKGVINIKNASIAIGRKNNKSFFELLPFQYKYNKTISNKEDKTAVNLSFVYVKN